MGIIKSEQKEVIQCISCEQEIYTCSGCGEYFKGKEVIFCDFNAEKHFCEDCIDSAIGKGGRGE